MIVFRRCYENATLKLSLRGAKRCGNLWAPLGSSMLKSILMRCGVYDKKHDYEVPEQSGLGSLGASVVHPTFRSFDQPERGVVRGRCPLTQYVPSPREGIKGWGVVCKIRLDSIFVLCGVRRQSGRDRI